MRRQQKFVVPNYGIGFIIKKTQLLDGRTVNPDLYRQFADEEQSKLSPTPELTSARRLLDQLVLSKQFIEFLTLIAYEQIK